MEYGSIFVIKGTMIFDRSNIRIDKQLLEQTPGGLHVVDCAVAEISEDVPRNSSAAGSVLRILPL